MTTPVRVQQSIRQLETKGLTHTQIVRELGVSRTTVVKYATRDYSPVPPTGETASRSLVAGEYARKADEWLEADRRMPHKQRHTARRAHERLVEECGFEGSYSSAQRWVKRWRQRHRGEAEGFSEMEWAPGNAQVDFGQALTVVAGVERTVHSLVISFPYSNMRYVAALPGETAECVCHGLNKVFSHAGMVPACWCSTMPPGSATAGPTGPSPRQGCSRCSARTTASRRGSATRIPGACQVVCVWGMFYKQGSIRSGYAASTRLALVS